MEYGISHPSGSRSDTAELESAHSSIIGVLLLITLVMVMGGIVSLMFLHNLYPDKVPIAIVVFSKTNDRVELMNKAGDTLTSSSVAIVVDGIDRTKEFRAPENTPDWKTLTPPVNTFTS